MATTTVSTLPPSTRVFRSSRLSIPPEAPSAVNWRPGGQVDGPEVGLDLLERGLVALDLRPGEPFAGAQQPVSSREHQDDPYGDGRIVEIIMVYTTETYLGEHEEDGD